MLRTLLLFLLCLLLPVPQGALAASSGKTPVQAETSLPLNRTTFHFFSPEDIAANYKASKIIRVGYFDQHGVFEGEGEHLSGYAVALLTAISRYTGWEYKWVKIRFDELAQRLDDGTIDLSCGISFTPERSRLYSFSKLRAGYENTCLHVSSMSDMHYMDLEAFNGMRIGFFTDSLQYDVMKRFAAQNGFSFESFFFEESNEMSQALAEGRIDGYVDGVLQGKGTKVVATISTDPFFFVTRKDDSAIMDPLNEAMRQILLNHPTYLARLYDSYLNVSSDVPVVFTRSECRWLATKPAIRVAYSREQDMMDPEHGGHFLYAFLKMLERQSGIRFEFLPLPSYDACLKALADGTADIMPDVYPQLSFLRSQNIFSGRIFYNAPITVVGRLHDKNIPGQSCTVGFTREMRSVMLAYQSAYPEDIPKIFPNIDACRKAFEKGEVDVYLWPYPAASLQDDPPKDGLLLPTRAMYPMALGISPHASPFVTSVLDKVITSTTTATIDALLLSAAPDSLLDVIRRFLRRNLVETLCGLGLLLGLIMLLVMRHNRRRLADLRAAALTDPVTQGPNRARFLIDAAKILQKDPRRYYLSTINIRKLKLINRACGLRTGDSLIRFCNREFALRSRQGELAAYSGSGQYLLLWRCPDETTFTQRMEELFSVADMARKLYQRPVSFSCGVYVICNDADMEEHEPQPTSGAGKKHQRIRALRLPLSALCRNGGSQYRFRRLPLAVPDLQRAHRGPAAQGQRHREPHGQCPGTRGVHRLHAAPGLPCGQETARGRGPHPLAGPGREDGLSRRIHPPVRAERLHPRTGPLCPGYGLRLDTPPSGRRQKGAPHQHQPVQGPVLPRQLCRDRPRHRGPPRCSRPPAACGGHGKHGLAG